MKKHIILSIASLLLWACKTKPVENKSADVSSKVSNTELFAAIHKKSDFEYLKINSKIDAKTGKFIPTIDATIYIENGEKVWMNMSALFFNVARGIATPEGIKGYEKWNKTYIESDFAYINNLLNVNFIDYQSFQNLLLGKTFIPVSEKEFTLTKNAQGFSLNTTRNQKIKVNGKTTEYKINLDYSSTFELNKVLLQEINS
ncbi:MAG: DUF4292 domain-containing protein, partial [Cruoricaptor ignavus]|nr:DUF4292 domain-containing protein [Cruoricaptor ignavus]